MKKILTSIMMIGLMFCLSACNMPWKKTEKKTEEKKQVIEASKVKGTMEGMTLNVGVSNEMAPFSYYDKEQKKIVGFDIDILEKVSEYLGFEYELCPMPMRDIEKNIKKGNLDFAIAGISITDDRQKEFAFTDAYYENTLKIMVHKEKGITDRKDLQGKVIGVEKGTSNARYVQDYMMEDNKVRYYNSMKEVFRDLEKGKIDATLYDTTGVEYYLKQHEKNTKLMELGEELNAEESNYGIMFAKGYENLDKFNVALQVLNTNGEYQEMKDKWIGVKE